MIYFFSTDLRCFSIFLFSLVKSFKNIVTCVHPKLVWGFIYTMRFCIYYIETYIIKNFQILFLSGSWLYLESKKNVKFDHQPFLTVLLKFQYFGMTPSHKFPVLTKVCFLKLLLKIKNNDLTRQNDSSLERK